MAFFKKDVRDSEDESSVKRAKTAGLAAVLIPMASAVIIMAVYTAVASFTQLSRLYTGIFCVALLIAISAVSVFVMRPKIDLETKESELHPLLGEIMLSSMSVISAPAFIADKSGRVVIWYNKEAGKCLKGERSLRGALVSDVLSDRELSQDGSIVKASFGDKIYSVSVRDISAGGKTYELYSFSEVTELERAKKYISENDVMIAYIMVDNLGEMLQQEQEEYRFAASSTETILRAWAAESGGVLKEYQTDRYIFFFKAKDFKRFEKDRFDILDRIRDVRVGSGSIPITVSIGISDVDGSFADKEKGAQTALETALQRGGDQAVVKNRDGSQSIYGGKTKTIQKKTNVRARIVANEVLVRISEASNVIIMAHKRPDFDAFGASLGMARLAKFCGVPVNIVTDFSFGGIEKCLERIKDEPSYEGMLVDGESALDLVTPDTLLIIVDVNNPAVYEEPHLADSCRNIIIIDHHRKTAELSREPLLSYIEPSASATCELVCGMLEQSVPEELILPREADIMLAGILLDTNQFKKNTGTRTFAAALYLRQRGADISAVQEFFKTTLDDYERENKFRSNVSIYRGVTAISIAEESGDSGDSIPASRAADKLLELEGIKASFVLIKIKDAIHISARSVGAINVQLILEQLKGGGHFDSAGAQIKDTSVEDVVKLLKDAIDKYMSESGILQ